MINIEDKSTCSGCKACAELCPKKCILMIEDEMGFCYPDVNVEQCINCGLCQKVCPTFNNVISNSLSYYVGYSNNITIRKSGSSGGIFGELANYIINRNGIVFGAGFTNQLVLKSMSAENKEELKSLYRSKYIQCDMKASYQKIKKELDDNRLVLFCSTPCNCQALKNYLKKDYDNLILTDFVCHGVSSQKLFNESLEYEKQKGKNIESFDFRSKEHNINCSRVYSATINGKKVNDIYLNFPYYYYYLDYISFRPSCYQCQFANEKRCTDITIGDLHEPEKLFPNENKLNGFSSIMCNNIKGEEIICRLDLNKIKVTKKDVVIPNACLNGPTISKKCKQFAEDYENIQFRELLIKYGFYSNRTNIKRIYYKFPLIVQKIIRKILIRSNYYV